MYAVVPLWWWSGPSHAIVLACHAQLVYASWLITVSGAALCHHAWRVRWCQIARDNAAYARLATFPDASTVTSQQTSRIFTSSASSFNQLTRLTTSRAVLACRNLDNNGQVWVCVCVTAGHRDTCVGGVRVWATQ